MKKLFILGLLVWGTGMAQAARTASFEPCRWWRYDYKTGTYTCNSTERRLTVYQSYEVDQLVRRLESRIQALEDRVQKLEQGR